MAPERSIDRRRFLAASVAALSVGTGRSASASGVRAFVGVDVVGSAAAPGLTGKRVGLLVHAASLTADGRHSIDALIGAGIRVVKLFGAEHGYRGLAAAGEKVADGVDAATGLPVVSLYGARSRPVAQDLDGLDVFVVDMQDAGVRFYTFAATMIHALEACAEIGVPMVILDRPNPLGGTRVEGPSSGPESEVPRTLVNLTPGPLVHGLTLGELARLVNAGRDKKAMLDVIPMKGWSRSMTWSDTGRTWTNPSPNLRSADACLAYPGTCLLEGTTATEGRGTEAPFLLIGAPWLKARELARAVEVRGFSCEATTFTPRASPAAPSPKYLDTPCQGLRIHVTDARAAEPYRLGVTLLVEMKRRQPEFGWLRAGVGFDRLAGTKRLRAAIDRGESADAIVAADAPAIAAFRTSRKPALLY